MVKTLSLDLYKYNELDDNIKEIAIHNLYKEISKKDRGFKEEINLWDSFLQEFMHSMPNRSPNDEKINYDIKVKNDLVTVAYNYVENPLCDDYYVDANELKNSIILFKHNSSFMVKKYPEDDKKKFEYVSDCLLLMPNIYLKAIENNKSEQIEKKKYSDIYRDTISAFTHELNRTLENKLNDILSKYAHEDTLYFLEDGSIIDIKPHYKIEEKEDNSNDRKM